MMARDGMPAPTVEATALRWGQGRNPVAMRRVKATIDIPEDVVVRNRDLLGHVLKVLLWQWGLGARSTRACAGCGGVSHAHRHDPAPPRGRRAQLSAGLGR
jgi:hypothetical protein